MENLSISYVDYPIASGKESVVFKAYIGKKPVAIKIFKISTIKFSTLERYIHGDRRFENERKDRSTRVFLWCRKEYTNLDELNRWKINAPMPYDYNMNVLIMQYLGTAKSPSPQLRNYGGRLEPLYAELRRQLRIMYGSAKLVHADLSEYNVLVYRKKPYFIDVGQMVDRRHPSADEFLRRDIFNISNFFRRKGIQVEEQELYDFVTGDSVE